MQLAVLPPEPEPAPSESLGEEQEEDGSMSQVHSDDEDDQLARLLQVCGLWWDTTYVHATGDGSKAEQGPTQGGSLRVCAVWLGASFLASLAPWPS